MCEDQRQNELRQSRDGRYGGRHDVVEEIRVCRDQARRGFAMILYQEGADRRPLMAHLDGSVTDLSDRGMLHQGVSVQLTDAQAQQLMDQLYADGLKPSGHSDPTPVLEAMRGTVDAKDEHISDLRMILCDRFVVRLDAKPVKNGGA